MKKYHHIKKKRLSTSAERDGMTNLLFSLRKIRETATGKQTAAFPESAEDENKTGNNGINL